MRIGKKMVDYYRRRWRQNRKEVKKRLKALGYEGYRMRRSKMMSATMGGKARLMTRTTIEKQVEMEKKERIIIRANYDLGKYGISFEFQFFAKTTLREADRFAEGRSGEVADRGSAVFAGIMDDNEIDERIQNWLESLRAIAGERYEEVTRTGRAYIRVVRGGKKYKFVEGENDAEN